MTSIKCKCGEVVTFTDDQPVTCECGETYMREYFPICSTPVILVTGKHGDQYYTKYKEVE
jgi:hypothetical protein